MPLSLAYERVVRVVLIKVFTSATDVTSAPRPRVKDFSSGCFIVRPLRNSIKVRLVTDAKTYFNKMLSVFPLEMKYFDFEAGDN